MDRHKRDPSPSKDQLNALGKVAKGPGRNVPTGFVWEQCAVHRLFDDKGYLVIGVYTKRACVSITITPSGLIRVTDTTKRTELSHRKHMAEGGGK